MKILVSACLLGRKCKYNGGDNLSHKVLTFTEGHEVIPVCPEIAGGLPVPRPSAEIVSGKVINIAGMVVLMIWLLIVFRKRRAEASALWNTKWFAD